LSSLQSTPDQVVERIAKFTNENIGDLLKIMESLPNISNENINQSVEYLEKIAMKNKEWEERYVSVMLPSKENEMILLREIINSKKWVQPYVTTFRRNVCQVYGAALVIKSGYVDQSEDK